MRCWAAILILAGAIAFFSSAAAESAAKKVCLKGVCLDAELADSEYKRQQGLMFRDGLADRQAMLFIFAEEDRQGFWMRNMRFGLDILWISAGKRIVHIAKAVSPCAGEPCEIISPDQKARYVLEVNAGFADKYGIRLGEKVNF